MPARTRCYRQAIAARRARPGTLIVSLALLLVGTGRAEQSETRHTDTAVTSRTASSLTESERARSAAWELTETEWHRYRALMRGIRGSVSSENLSPIEVLGIHARDTAERQHYARRWAEIMRADAERVLAFQRAYDAAAERLSRGQQLIDAGRLKTVSQPTSALQPGDRVLLFATMDCPACEATLAKLLTYLSTVAGIDIYFTDLARGADEPIRDWAGRQGITPAWVKARRVTLNFDNGLLESLAEIGTAPPALFVRRNGELTRLAYAAL